MAAQWIEPLRAGQPLQLILNRAEQEPLAALHAALDDRLLQHPGAGEGTVELDAGDLLLAASTLAAMRERLEATGFGLAPLVSANPHTRVAAAALGIGWIAPIPRVRAIEPAGEALALDLTLHRGTVRSGDQLEAAGSLLVLGDVNPGARVQAGGHVLVWGRLRGVAHAGCNGDTDARIVAMQLRPLQLRIADVVARGPEEPPPAGLAEEARLVDGAIRIDAASPIWPLSG